MAPVQFVCFLLMYLAISHDTPHTPIEKEAEEQR